MTNGYIALLRDRQIAEGWSYSRMANELGVSKSNWYRFVTGEREPTLPFIRSAMRRFPEYSLVLMNCLPADGPLGLPRREVLDAETVAS